MEFKPNLNYMHVMNCKHIFIKFPLPSPDKSVLTEELSYQLSC